MKNPVNGFVPEMVKVVPTPTGKVDVVAGESVVAPSVTVNPPIASDPVIIVKAVVCGSETIAALPPKQLPVPVEKACT